MLLKCNIVDGGKLAEAKAKLERAKSNRCDVENYLISWKEAFPTESSWDFIIREKKRQQLQRGRVEEKFLLSYFSPLGHAGSLQETERWIFRICAPGRRAWSPAERDGGGWDFSLRIDFYLHSEFIIRDLFLFYCSGGPQVRTQQPGQDGEGVVGGWRQKWPQAERCQSLAGVKYIYIIYDSCILYNLVPTRQVGVPYGSGRSGR